MGWNVLSSFICDTFGRLSRTASVALVRTNMSAVVLADIASCSPTEALQRLDGAVDGLPGAEAQSRPRAVGPNEIAHEARHTILREIVTRSINPLNGLLLALAVIS